jgi:predicted PurR-regulated permease PerM
MSKRTPWTSRIISGANQWDPGASFRRWLFALVVLLVIIASIYVLGWAYGVLRYNSNIVALFFTAWLLQFFLSPVVDFLTRHHLPRQLAVIYVYLVLALAVIIAFVALIPGIYNQARLLADSLSHQSTQNQIFSVISHTTQAIQRFLVDQLHVSKEDVANFTRQYSISVQKGVLAAGTSLQKLVLQFLAPGNILVGATNVVNIFSALSTALINFVIVLVLAYYMTLDGSKLMRRFMGYFPPVVDEMRTDVTSIVNRKFAGYLRGQLILAAVYGFLTYLIALAFNLSYPLLIGLFAAIMMLIPFIGTFIAVVPPIVVFLVTHPFHLPTFLILLVLLVGSQQLVINFLAPRVMGNAVGMHPLLVVLGLLLGVKVAGLWGAIFGVPIFGVLVDTVDLVYRRVMAQRYGFRPSDPHEVDAGDQGEPPGAPARPATQTAPLVKAAGYTPASARSGPGKVTEISQE